MVDDKISVVGTNIAEKATMIWNVADMLRGLFTGNAKLAGSAKTLDPRIFTESVFPAAFGTAASESYMESQDSYSALFEDQAKYNAVMSALAGVIYREMRRMREPKPTG